MSHYSEQREADRDAMDMRAGVPPEVRATGSAAREPSATAHILAVAQGLHGELCQALRDLSAHNDVLMGEQPPMPETGQNRAAPAMNGVSGGVLAELLFTLDNAADTVRRLHAELARLRRA